jgi:hypothetical protein
LWPKKRQLSKLLLIIISTFPEALFGGWAVVNLRLPFFWRGFFVGKPTGSILGGRRLSGCKNAKKSYLESAKNLPGRQGRKGAIFHLREGTDLGTLFDLNIRT